MYVQVAPSSSLPLPLLQKSIPPTPTLKNVFWLQAKKKNKTKTNKQKRLFTFLQFWSKTTKKLVTLIPTGKTVGCKNSSFRLIKPITSGPLISNPFWRLITPEEQQVTEAKEEGRSSRRNCGIGRKARWRGSKGCLLGTAVQLYWCKLSPFAKLWPSTSEVLWAGIATPRLCQDDPNADEKLIKTLLNYVYEFVLKSRQELTL